MGKFTQHPQREKERYRECAVCLLSNLFVQCHLREIEIFVTRKVKIAPFAI
jgi:hypothetical protein